MGLFSKLLDKGPQRPAVRLGPSWAQPTTLGPGVGLDVVGESHYQRALEWAAQGKTEDGCRVGLVMAELVRDPGNRHDRHAVRVDIAGRTVGYVPRADARSLHEVINHLWSHGYPATCRAELTGGWNRGRRDQGSIGVVLGACLPLDTFRPDRHHALPDGARISVTGEQNYQDTLAKVLGKKEQTDVVAHLESADSVITVSIGGEAIGNLTPKMSARYLPLLDHAKGVGLDLTSRTLVMRGQNKLEAFVRLPKAPDRLLQYGPTA